MLDELEIAAKRLLIERMKALGLGYAGLSERLEKIGILESADSLNRKMNRQSFRASFLLACLVALDVKALDLSSIDLSPRARTDRLNKAFWLEKEKEARRRRPLKDRRT